jgi:hypothetical protein
VTLTPTTLPSREHSLLEAAAAKTSGHAPLSCDGIGCLLSMQRGAMGRELRLADEASPGAAEEPIESYYDLGHHTRRVTTSWPDAQLWFDRGLNWTFAFGHEEAVRCFERTLGYDPRCAMAQWGITSALGPNSRPGRLLTRSTWSRRWGRTHLVTQQALALRNEASPVECALIDAPPARYQSAEPPASIEDLNRWNDDYADAIRVVHNDYGIDLGIAALFAEALLKQRCRTLDGVGYTANYRGDT